MNREDFPMLKNNLVYLDNGATSLKPNNVIDSITEYYTSYSANAHRGDYDISLLVDETYESVREKAKKYINAKEVNEIVFTSGATEALNIIINGFFGNYLKKGDEVLITVAEHASLVLPWFNLANKLGIIIKYIPLNNDLEVTLDNVIKMININTKVISIAHITNVIGDKRPIKEIVKYAHERGIYVLVDGAQSIGHTKVDVQDLDIDFLAFSAHKMMGPTGVGVIYGKYELLNQLHPQILGGGMNIDFTSEKDFEFKSLPCRLEAGTPNISGVIGFGAAIDYINNIGIDVIEKHDLELRKYAVDKLQLLNKIKIYNLNTNGSIITFNVDNIFSQDLAVYLNKHNICVRAGNHCTKLLKNIGINNTCRISLYLYNTKEEIDQLVIALSNNNILEESL